MTSRISTSELQAPRKKRHAAQRIWKRQMDLGVREVFVAQIYALGQEVQVEWFEGTAIVGGGACKL